MRNTEFIVRYRFHPWFEQSVRVLQAIHRRQECYFRVEHTSGERARRVDLPAWMFDASACAGMILLPAPIVSLDALMQLQSLLKETAPAGGHTAAKTEHLSSQPIGDAHADSQNAARCPKTIPP